MFLCARWGACPLNTMNAALSAIQLISGTFEHSMLLVWEIYALENVCVLHYSVCAVQTINYWRSE